MSNLNECPDCGFTWHPKHGEECASCQCDELRQQLDETRHVLIEESDFPKNPYCKCLECKRVAARMDAAGWGHRAKDRWWES